MKSFITGIDGFIGSYLCDELIARGDNVAGLSKTKSGNFDGVIKYKADLTNQDKIVEIIKKEKPDRLFHLAAQSNIPRSFDDPQETVIINVNGTVNLLEAVRQFSPKTIFISIGSSAEYGKTARQNKKLSEDLPLTPSSPYGISKATQGYFCALYHRAYKIKTIHVRPFAVIGPGKVGDALYDFCQGIIKIENKKSPELLVGNLTAIRDFIDVRDMVKAMVLLSQKGNWGETYNICSGKGTSLEQILTTLKKISLSKIKVKIDKTRLRPADDPTVIGSPSKLIDLRFKSQYSFKTTLKDTLEYWRNHQD